MTDKIVVTGVRALGRHGFSHELNHPQPFVVDAELRLDLSRAAESDDLAHTVDYALVVQEIRRTIEQETFALIESMADSIASRLLGFGPASVRVRVSKPVVALNLGASDVAVEIERSAG